MWNLEERIGAPIPSVKNVTGDTFCIVTQDGHVTKLAIANKMHGLESFPEEIGWSLISRS